MTRCALARLATSSPLHLRGTSMPSYRRLVAGAAATLVLAGCATAPAKDPAPPVVLGQTLQMWQAEVPGTSAKAIFVRNDGAQTIVITEVRLTTCVNVRQ